MKNKILSIAVICVSIVVIITVIVCLKMDRSRKIALSNEKFNEFYVESSSSVKEIDETVESSSESESLVEYSGNESATAIESSGAIYSESGFNKFNVKQVGQLNVVSFDNADDMISDCYPIYGESLYSKLEEMNEQYAYIEEQLGSLIIKDTVRLEKDGTYWKINCSLTDGDDVFLVAIRTTEIPDDGTDVFGDERTYNKSAE